MTTIIINFIISLFILFVAYSKVNTTGEQVLVCLIFLIATSIHFQVGQSLVIQTNSTMTLLKSVLRIRALNGDKEVKNDYSNFMDAREELENSVKNVNLNTILLAITYVLSIFLMLVANKY